MCRQCLLLLRKRHRWRRRRFLGDNLPACYCRRRRSHAARSRRLCAQNTLSCRSHCNPGTHRRRGDIARTHRNRYFRHRLRAHERVLRHHHHRTLDVSIGVRDVRNVSCVIDDRRAVDVCNGDIRDGGIADVDPGHVRLADVIRRHIHFPRAKREPAHIAAPAARSAADENHQRRRIHRLHRHRTGHPAPSSANTHPATIVKGRVAP